MIKDEIGVFGIDDAPFNKNDKNCLIIGTYMRGNRIVDGVYFKKIEKDGLDSTEKIIKMVINGRHKTKIKVIFLDGITFGGFNIVNMYEIYELTGIPVVSIMEKEPNYEKIYSAIKKYFDDWRERIELIESLPKPKKINDNTSYIQNIGIDKNKVEDIIKKTRLRSKIPECLRLSHLIGRGFLDID